MRRHVAIMSLLSAAFVVLMAAQVFSEIIPSDRQPEPGNENQSNLMQQGDFYRRRASRTSREQPEPLAAGLVEENSRFDYVALILLVASIVALVIFSRRSQVGSRRRT